MSREELYKLVWAEPMRNIAKRFGISDVALAKRCRKMNIPVPGRGHWTRQQAGYKVAPPPLPAWKKTYSSEIAIRRTEKHAPPPIEEAEEGKELIEFEKDPKNRIVVSRVLEEPHPLILPTRKVLERAKPDDRGLLVAGPGTSCRTRECR